MDEDKSNPVKERGHFLDGKQKAIKQKMMEELMEVFFGNLQANKELFTTQNVIDLVCSVLIMFNREIFVHLITSLDIIHHRKQIMKNLFESIKDEVNNRIKRGMM